MSYIEKFTLLFNTNASDAARETDNLDKKLDGLSHQAGKADNEIKSLGKSSVIAKDSFYSLAGGVAGAFAAFVSVDSVLTRINEVDSLGHMAERLGENVGDLDAWQKSAVAFKGSADGMMEDFKRLNDQAFDFSHSGGGEGADIFEKFNISVRDSEGQLKKGSALLLEIADNVKGISAQEISGIGEMMGFHTGTVNMLIQGRHAIEAQIKTQKELGVVNQETFEASKRFNEQLNKTKGGLQAMATGGIGFLLPFLTDGLDLFNDLITFLQANQTLVEGFFIGAASAVTIYYLPAMISAATATIAAISPFIAIAAAVTAVGVVFALAYEDVKKFLDGQESMIGKLMETYPKFAEVIGSVFDGVKSTLEWLSNAFDWVLEKINYIISAAKSAIDLIPSFGSDEDTPPTSREQILENAQLGANTVSSMNKNPLNNQSPQSVSNRTSSSNVKIDKIEVVTQATDAEGIAREVAGSLESQIRDAQSNYDDGVLA